MMLEEIRNDAYDHVKHHKAKMRAKHDQGILRRKLKTRQKVLLYDSRLHLFPNMLRTRWTGPFIIAKIYPHGATELTNPKNGKIFKVNGHWLKPFLESFE